MAFADLHIHSLYSDGSYTPEEIVRIARASNVDLISICDHNQVQGTLECAPIARAAGLKYIPGVEIDAIHNGMDLHILCYGADLSDANLLARIHHARWALDEMSTELLRRMLKNYPSLSMADYEAFPHDTKKGGWKMLQYLCARGVTPDLKSGFPLYDRYGVTYADAGFDSAETILSAIHAAGGKAVLAHPGVVFPTGRLTLFEQHLQDALDLGMDGVECHYVRHSAGITRSCLDICRDRGLLITAGSDCHGAFNHNEIGQTKTPVSELKLYGLI
jgi:predicted metal-dependent phosphoesterase TrpH